MVDFFLLWKNHPKSKMEGWCDNEYYQRRITIWGKLKEKTRIYMWILYGYSYFINSSIRKIEKTNISYIEPHKVIIKDTTFLVFNYSNDVYISNLTEKIKLSELEEYLKSM